MRVSPSPRLLRTEINTDTHAFHTNQLQQRNHCSTATVLLKNGMSHRVRRVTTDAVYSSAITPPVNVRRALPSLKVAQWF